MPKTNSSAVREKATRAENFAYIHDMLGELRKVAESENADMLCYIIEMAFIETGDIISRSRSASSGLEDKRN